MKYIIYIMTAIITLNTAYAYISYDYNINHSKLPFNTTIYYTLNNSNDLNITIEHGIFTFGDNKLQYINNTNINISFFIYVPNTTRAENITDMIQLKSELFNETIFFHFNITNDTIVINRTEYIAFNLDAYEFPICNTLLPYNTSINNFIVKGLPNSSVIVSYNSTFFNLANFILSDEGIKSLNIMITVPTLPVGKHNQQIKFNIGNISYNLSISFDIRQCIKPVINIYALLEECKMKNFTSLELQQCIMEAQNKYINSVLASLADLKEQYTTNNTIKEYINNTIEHRIPVLDLNDEAIIKEITSLPETVNLIKQVQFDLEQMKKTQADLSIANQNNLTQLSTKLSTDLSILLNENNALKGNISQYEENYITKSSIIILIVFLLLIGIVIYLYYLYNLNEIYSS